MVQLWVNLPAAEKMSPPRYQELLDADIPHVSLPDGAGTVRVIAGDFQGAKGAARTVTPINLWDVQLSEAGESQFDLPDGHTALIVVQSGAIRINEQTAKAVELAELDRAGTQVGIAWETPARLLVLTGQPINEPVFGQGPFVMNTREEIKQAIADYQQGRMGRLA
jgi:redox-sensitive bicupin YhaK (pirin superfamily)